MLDICVRERRGAMALVVVLVVAAAVRLLPYGQVFTPGGVAVLGDGDAYYHLVRAVRLASSWPDVPWRDSWMNFPEGASIPWPPFFDLVVATVAVATGSADSERIAAVAAVVPVVAGVLVVFLTAVLGGLLLGRRISWESAALVALLPAAIGQSVLGRPDHHVFEVLLSTAAFLAYAAALVDGPRKRWSIVLGGALALSFWNWPGSAMYLLLLAVHVAVLHVVTPPGDPAPGRAARVLAGGAAVAAGILVVTIASWGPPGALSSGSLTPISGLSPVLCAFTAVGALFVSGSRKRLPHAGAAARLSTIAVPLGLVGGGLIALEPVRAGVARGIAAFSGSGSWHATIGEFWPIVFSGVRPWPDELLEVMFAFGLVPLALPFAAWLMWSEARRQPDRRAALLFLATWCLGAVAITLARRRFLGYAVVPLAIVAALTCRELLGALRQRTNAVVARFGQAAALAAMLAPAVFFLAVAGPASPPAHASEKHTLLRWLGEAPPVPGRESVLSSWSDGHEVQWFARRPVLSTPFGSEIDGNSMHDAALFFLEQSPDPAEAVLARRRVGHLLLGNPVQEVLALRSFAPDLLAPVFEERSVRTGRRFALEPRFFDLVASRLFFFDGLSRTGATQGLGTYRLLAESRAGTEVAGFRAQSYKLFGVVPGAVLEVRGIPPGIVVSADVQVSTLAGRHFTWSTHAVASHEGATLRVPYATGRNGLVLARAYRVIAAGGTTSVPVSERQVVAGEAVEVRFAAPATH